MYSWFCWTGASRRTPATSSGSPRVSTWIDWLKRTGASGAKADRGATGEHADLRLQQPARASGMASWASRSVFGSTGVAVGLGARDGLPRVAVGGRRAQIQRPAGLDLQDRRIARSNAPRGASVRPKLSPRALWSLPFSAANQRSNSPSMPLPRRRDAIPTAGHFAAGDVRRAGPRRPTASRQRRRPCRPGR